MFSADQRKKAIETFVKSDHSYADTVAGLGYPTRATLRSWWKEYESTGETPAGKGRRRKSMCSDEQARTAVSHCLEHGKSLARTMRALGYPKGSDALRGWIDELAPGERKRRAKVRLGAVPDTCVGTRRRDRRPRTSAPRARRAACRAAR